MLNYQTSIKEDKSYVDLKIKEIKPIMKLIIRGKKKRVYYSYWKKFEHDFTNRSKYIYFR